MRTVLLCRDLDALSRRLPSPPEPIRYLILRESQASLRIRTHLQQRGGSEELPRAVLFRERSARFRAEYVNALGRLNAERGSRDWWAMPFTTKNPISTDLCRNTFAFLLIVDLVRKTEGLLVVVTDSEALAGQVEAWGSDEGVAVTNVVKSAWTVRELVKRLAPLAVLLLMGRALWFRLRMGAKTVASVAEGDHVVAIVTLVHPHSLSPEGRFRDTYFGGLSEWLVSRNVPVVVAGLIQGQSVALARAFQSGDGKAARIPLDAVLGPGEILCCGWSALRAFLSSGSWNATVGVHGVNIECLIAHAIREAHASGEVFLSLYVYRCARRLGARARIVRCVYPYENRAWEKMLLLGIRADSPATRMVGYQHASITASHTNFMLVDKEPAVIPLPDVVVTMGTVTKDWLIREGRHSTSSVMAGCALRQARTVAGALRQRRAKRVARVLVALATSQTEYLGTLTFLNEAVAPDKSREVRIRPHPTLSLDEAVRLLPEGRARFSYTTSRGPVAEDLAWADVVLYASSTIGLEAVGMGVPAVYLDLGDILDTDPMGGWTEFKWIAREPKDLRVVLTEIEALSDDQYGAHQQRGQAYAEACLYPVTDKNLEIFCEA
ncbi:MAG: hypothetical protein D4R81_02330 [Nitrospiraceae bacterium]|nr:MAG: hypothetical protein D4R81_02330 [Nitrospiraceae bacterium]